jgi:hypothetical protein
MKKIIPFLCIGLLLATGCATTQHEKIAQISCCYRFKDVRRVEDQLRIDAAIRSVAVSPPQKTGTPAYPEYRFNVARLSDLDRIQPALVYDNSSKRPWRNRQQTLNAKTPVIDAVFESTDISATMELVVVFSIKPGSKLLYINENRREVDITSRVAKNGHVTLKAHIARGQKYIYARAVKDDVSRYIKIAVHNQQVVDATAREYRQQLAH